MTPVSIILVTYNSALHLADCLAALSADQRPGDEIIVVDNGSHDDSVAVAAQCAPDAQIVAATTNWGFAGGVELGIARAQQPIIALLNPDARPAPGWTAALAAALDDPRVGVAAAKVLGDDGRLQSVGCVVDDDALLPSYRGANEADHGQYDAPAAVWSAHGAAMAFRRTVWAEVGGFDSGFFPAYLEESDFCERVRQRGYQIMTAPAAVVRHSEAVTTGKHSAEFFYYFLRNRLRYAAKWRAWPELWGRFRLAEHRRLHTAPLLDRQVARLVYAAGLPSLAPLSAADRAAILATGQLLRTRGAPDDEFTALLPLLAAAQSGAHLAPRDSHRGCRWSRGCARPGTMSPPAGTLTHASTSKLATTRRWAGRWSRPPTAAPPPWRRRRSM